MNRFLKRIVLSLLAGSIGLITSAQAQSARELLVAGRVDDAISTLQSQVRTYPNDAPAHNLLCRAYYSVERWDDAVTACEAAIHLNPNRSEFQMWMGRAYGEKAQRASVFSQLGLARRVRDSFEKAVQLDGHNVDAHSDLAEFYMEAPGIVGGGADKARGQAEAVAALDPGIAQYIRGRLAENDKDDAKAEQAYKSATQSAKEPAGQWLNLALFYSKRQRWDDLDAALNKAAALAQGKSSGVLLESATVLGKANRNLPLATLWVRTYLASGQPSEDHSIFRAHWVLGRLLEKQGDKAGAAQEYKAAVALARDFHPAQESLRKLQGRG